MHNVKIITNRLSARTKSVVLQAYARKTRRAGAGIETIYYTKLKRVQEIVG